MDKLEYLESERKKIWERIVDLQDQIKKRTSDYESEAKQSSKKASEYRNKAEAAKNQAVQLLTEIQKDLEASKNSESQIRAVVTKLLECNSLLDEVKNTHDELSSQRDSINEKFSELETLLEDYPSYEEKISVIESHFEKSTDLSTKIETTYNQAFGRKKEIDQLYQLINGYSNKDEATGKETIVPGLKAELENSYKTLKENFSKFEESEKKKFSDTIQSWKNDYKTAYDQIQTLLPNALTAGLSHAYSKKKDEEVNESKSLNNQFTIAVLCLVGVSLVPFAVGIYQLLDGVPLADALLQLPRLVLSILPLYIPFLWLAYSANKKVNLSKRLIEEYTHKEVLSKTFEGLAEQISKIKDQKVSADLKTKLLYNILEVSSENPGKLISNYDKSDHPLMDVLDRSIKLSNAIEKVSKIPGMKRLSKYLDEQSDELNTQANQKASSAIDKVTT